MDAPYKRAHKFMYTEYIYYDASGNEIGTRRLYDDELYDWDISEPLTDDELEDFGLTEDA